MNPSYSHLRLLVLDVDGVLTDGKLYYDASGECLKVFHVRDGHGIKALRAAGVEVAIISGRRSPALERRASELGIPHVLTGIEDKGQALAQLLTALDVRATAVACVGDDTPDVPMLRMVGFPVAVADAHPRVKAAARHVLQTAGGHGAVRELSDLILGEAG